MRAQNCDCKVLSHRAVSDTIRLLDVKWEDMAHAPKAGQFYMLRCWRQDEAPLLSRPISVHEWSPDTGVVSFLYEVRGEGTHKLAALLPGDASSSRSPMEGFFSGAVLRASAWAFSSSCPRRPLLIPSIIL